MLDVNRGERSTTFAQDRRRSAPRKAEHNSSAGLTGEYDWELPYSRVDKTVLFNAVREKLGLEITEINRRLRF